MIGLKRLWIVVTLTWVFYWIFLTGNAISKDVRNIFQKTSDLEQIEASGSVEVSYQHVEFNDGSKYTFVLPINATDAQIDKIIDQAIEDIGPGGRWDEKLQITWDNQLVARRDFYKELLVRDANITSTISNEISNSKLFIIGQLINFAVFALLPPLGVLLVFFVVRWVVAGFKKVKE